MLLRRTTPPSTARILISNSSVSIVFMTPYVKQKNGHRLVRHASRDHETSLRVAPHSVPDYQIVNNRMCYTGHATVGKPRRSSKPKTILAHWTAWPAAPLHKLSIAPVATSTPARLLSARPIWAALVPTTEAVLGCWPASSTRTKVRPA